MLDLNSFYMVWSGALNFGDTPGVFNNAQFVGLLAQIPITLTFVSDDNSPKNFLLQTTDVEIFNERTHPVYWDWVPGNPFPSPIGFINDIDPIVGSPEYHELTVPSDVATEGTHTITILVNPEEEAGLKDDFVLEKILASNSIGAKVGW